MADSTDLARFSVKMFAVFGLEFSLSQVYASGVHHFCRHDRSFEEASIPVG